MKPWTRVRHHLRLVFLKVKVEELGRPVTLGEVFTRKNDGVVDKKAQQVAEAYHKNKQAKLAALESENSETVDSASPDPQLSFDEDNELFLLSTITDARGQPYGIGSLKSSLVNGKRKFSPCSSSFMDLKTQLEDAHHKIEEQVALNAKELEAADNRTLLFYSNVV